MLLAFLHALLKVNEDLKTVGALAGLAAVPGLGVLALLYFGQAREVRRLREWAGRAPERAAELEARVTADAARRAQGQVAPAPAVTPRPATAAATPAGQAANGVAQPPKPEEAKKEGEEAKEPAVAAAAAKKDGEEAKPPEGQEAAAKEGEDKKEGEEAKKEPAAPAVPGAAVAAAAAGAAAAPTATAATAAAPPKTDGQAASSPPRTAPATAAATAQASRPRPPAPPIPPRPAQPARAASPPSATIPPRSRLRDARASATSRFGRGGILAIAAVVLALVVVAIVIAKVTGGGGGSPAPRTPNSVGSAPAAQPSSKSPASTPAATRAQRAQTNVAVLNGTTVTGLARSVSDRLQQQGFNIETVTDAANQTQADTRVEYANGQAGEARDVARSLKVPAAQVVPITQVESDVAGPNAEVVVLVGQNFAK